MTPALSVSDLQDVPRRRVRRNLLVLCIYGCLASVYFPTSVLEAVRLPALLAGLSLTLLVKPLEYALGVVGFAFLAAASFRLSDQFLTARWIYLGVAAVALTLRFFLRDRKGRRPTLNRFDYLITFFVIIAAFTVTTSLSPELSALKLAGLICLLYVGSRGASRLVEQCGPAAARHMIFGLLTFVAPLAGLPLAGWLLSVGPPTTYMGWFSGYLAHPNSWALLVVTLLPWMSPPLLRRAQRWGLRHWTLAGAVALVLLSLLRSGSRAGLLAAAVSGSVICLIHENRRIGVLMAIATVALASKSLADPAFLPGLVQRYLVKHRGATEVLQSRREPWKIVQKQFRAHPWFGMGFGVSSESQVAWKADVQTGGSIVETGSSVWSALTQVGLAGSSLLFLALAGLLLQGGRFAWQVRDPWFTAMYASVVGMTVNAFFEGWLLAPGNFGATYFWLQCFCLNAVMSHFRPRSRWEWTALQLPGAKRVEALR